MKRDARKLKTDTQQEIRRQAIEILSQGVSRNEIAHRLSVHRSTIMEWKNWYAQGGMDALEMKKRGPKIGSWKTLSSHEIIAHSETHYRQTSRTNKNGIIKETRTKEKRSMASSSRKHDK